MKIILLLLLLPAPAIGQAPVSPIRLQVVTPEENTTNNELCRSVRIELNKRKNVAIVSRRADFEVFLVASPITQEQAVVGYAVAALVIESSPSKTTEPFKLWVFIGPSLEDVARRFTAQMDREFFAKRRQP